MAITKKTYTRAITFGVIAALACFLLPFILGVLVKDNDWKSLGVGNDDLEYILIYPSWVKSIALGMGLGGWILALIFSALLGYAIGFGSQDLLWTPNDPKSDDTGWILGLSLAGLVLCWVTYWTNASNAHSNTSYTIPKSEFVIKDAKHGKYDQYFHKYAQPDTTSLRAFPVQNR